MSLLLCLHSLLCGVGDEGSFGLGRAFSHGKWLDVWPQYEKGKKAPPKPVQNAAGKGASSIFVEISAYRDDLCGITLKELFGHAAHPDRLYVGIVDQTMPGDTACVDQYCQLAAEEQESRRLLARSKHLRHAGGYRRKKKAVDYSQCPHVDQIVVHAMDATDAKGPAYARSFQDELLRQADSKAGMPMEFCMQIDAHSETLIDWDVYMIDEWFKAENEFAVLSTYVSGIESKPKDNKLDLNDELKEVPILCETERGERGMPRNSQAGAAHTLHAPMLGCLWGAGLSFNKCHAERAVKTDPNTAGVFDGEEFTKMARLWTNGYDVYNPSRAYIFHNYRKAQSSPKRWSGGEPEDVKHTSYKRLFTLLEMDGGDRSGVVAKALQDGGYGLGHLRTLTQFQKFCSIDLARNVPADGRHCGQMLWVPWSREQTTEERVREIESKWQTGASV